MKKAQVWPLFKRNSVMTKSECSLMRKKLWSNLLCQEFVLTKYLYFCLQKVEKLPPDKFLIINDKTGISLFDSFIMYNASIQSP